MRGPVSEIKRPCRAELEGISAIPDMFKMQQGGMERPESVMDMFNEVYSQLGQRGAGGTASVNQEANLALSEMTGLSLDQVETLGDLLNSGKSQEEIMAGVKEQMEKAEPVEKQALKEMKKGFGGMVSYLAGIEAKQIAIGAKFSKVFERIQQLQLKALSFVADYVPKIEHWIKEAYVALKEIINIGAVQLKTGEQQAYKEMMAKSRKEMEELYGSAMSGSVAQRLKNLQQQEAVLKARIGKLTLGALRGGSMGGVNARATSAIAGMFGVGEGAETQQERRRAAMELRREMERIKAQKKVLSELRSTVGLHGRGGDIEKLLDVSQGEALGYGAAPTRLKHRLKMGAISQRLTRTGAAGGAERGMTKEELQQETGRGSRAGHDARTTKPKVTGGGGKGGKRKATGGRLTF